MIRRWIVLGCLILGIAASTGLTGDAAASRDQDGVLNLWAESGDTKNPSSVNTWIGSGFLVDATGQLQGVINGVRRNANLSCSCTG